MHLNSGQLAGSILLMITLATGCAGRMNSHSYPLSASELSSALVSTVSPLKPTTNLPNPTDPIRKQYYASWPEDIQVAVDHHVLLVGMDKLQAQVALGFLESRITKNVTTNASEITETWSVWRSAGWWSPVKPGESEVTIVFQGGKMIDFHRVKWESGTVHDLPSWHSR